MKNNTCFLVVYNDKYGSFKSSYEIIVRTKEDFEKWFKEHNKIRVSIGEEKERIDEFDLIELKIYSPK